MNRLGGFGGRDDGYLPGGVWDGEDGEQSLALASSILPSQDLSEELRLYLKGTETLWLEFPFPEMSPLGNENFSVLSHHLSQVLFTAAL